MTDDLFPESPLPLTFETLPVRVVSVYIENTLEYAYADFREEPTIKSMQRLNETACIHAWWRSLTDAERQKETTLLYNEWAIINWAPRMLAHARAAMAG